MNRSGRRTRHLALLLIALTVCGVAVDVQAQEERRPAGELIPSAVFVLGGLQCETEPAPDGDPMGIPVADTCEGSLPASGTIVSPEKLIMTSATVALDANRENPVWTVIFLTTDARSAPTAAFFGRPIIYDEKLDLALLQPKYSLAGEPVSEDDLLALTPLEMSGEEAGVDLEQPIRLIGYPMDAVVGKETISVVPAEVAGFFPDEANPELGGGAFFKADSSTGPGMNGGTVVDESGALIGVPSSSRGGNVQCVDVDGDGELDQGRECIVRGGEISFIRPIPEGINLLYERAEAAGQLGGNETPAPSETPLASTADPAASPGAGPVGRTIPFPTRGGVATQPPADTALLEGTLVSADTSDPIEGGYFILLQPGTTVREFVDSKADAALVFALGISAGNGQFQVRDRVEREQEYSFVVLAEGFEPLAGDDQVFATSNDPATVDLGDIPMKSEA